MESNRQSGQASISLVLVLTFMLLGGAGFAGDLANAWLHRQSAQSASDAACQAASMDMYADAAGATLPNAGLVAGQNGDCSTASGASLCRYAAMNGYNGTGLSPAAASNDVAWTWPATVVGATAPPTAITSNPFLQVTVTENLPTYLIRAVGGPKVLKVSTTSTCGLVQEPGAVPIIILNPILPASLAMAVDANLTIVSGPQRGLQVNSWDPLAVLGVVDASVNTSQGGPSDAGSGVGVTGGPPVSSGGLLGTGFSGGSKGSWNTGVAPMPDPFAGVGPPSGVTGTPASGLWGTTVSYHQDGCPDKTFGCLEFAPGFYPLGINLATLLSGKRTAIFLPGVYSLGGPVTSTGNILRNATPCTPSCGPLSSTTGSQTDGVMFYFWLGSMTIAGTPNTTNVDPVPSTSLSCDGSAPDPNLGMPATVNGTVLWAQCTAHGTYTDAAADTVDSAASPLAPGTRGILFFANHLNILPPTFAAVNGMVFSGAIYFHNVLYLDIVPFAATSIGGLGGLLGGSSGTGIYILGPMVVDQLTIAAATQVNVGLSATGNQYLTKAGLIG